MIVSGRDRLPGGYISVDISFVISGYLISRIVLSELSEKGSFSFSNG
jgi:peptidoglycan/LPS O-acetylase OafA/YrhL